MNKEKKEHTVINISVDSHKKIKELAQKEKRSIRSMIEILVDDRIKSNSKVK